MRPGNVYTSSGAPEFLKECLKKIPPGIYRIRVRADSGFYDHKFIEPLDQEGIGYVIVAKMTRPIRNTVGNLRYHRFEKSWAAAVFFYQPLRWKKAHRFIVIRRPLPEKDSEQLTLFALKRCTYHVFVTDLPLRAEKIWYFYRPRAAIEVIIRELKESYALAKIPTNSFQANQFYFHLLLLAYNLVNWFKRLCLPPRFQNATIETIRTPYCPNVLIEKSVNYKKAFRYLKKMLFFDLNLKCSKCHTFFLLFEEMAYECWENDLVSINGVPSPNTNFKNVSSGTRAATRSYFFLAGINSFV